ncbi:hypothetical protein C9426_09335 [Serratia sp. S1B]|nr:hypothetical protein C9426_09335 [Serratia sp. S1B]
MTTATTLNNDNGQLAAGKLVLSAHDLSNQQGKYVDLTADTLHQYQRDEKRVQHRGEWLEYIEVARSDIELTNQLAHEVLGMTLDEMPPQTRNLLVLLRDWLIPQAQEHGSKLDEVRFTRRDVRSALKWGDTQLKVHLARLLEMEYLVMFRCGLTYEYVLLWDGEDNGEAHLCGVLESGEASRSGSEDNRSVEPSLMTLDKL